MKTNDDEIVKTDGKKTNSKSKKNGFTRFYRAHQNFREDIFAKAAEKHKTAIAVMAMTGCRPAELKELINLR